MLLDTLGAGLLGNILAAKVLIRTGGVVCRVGKNFKFHLTLWQILVKYYQNEPNFLKFTKKWGFKKKGLLKQRGMF